MSVKTSTLESIQSDLRKLVDPTKAKTREKLEYLEFLIKDEAGVELPKELIEYFERYVPANKFIRDQIPDGYFTIPLNVAEAIEHRLELISIDEDIDEDDIELNCDSTVSKRWFAPHWIPLFSSGNGSYLCYDAKPEKGGKQGQIVQFIHDTGDRTVVGHFKDIVQARLNPPIRKVKDFERQAKVKIPKEVLDFYQSLYFEMSSGILFYNNNARHDIIGLLDWSDDPAGSKEIFTKVEDGLKAITLAKLYVGMKQEIEYNILYMLDSNGYQDGEIYLFDKGLNPVGKIANNLKEFFSYNEVVDVIASLTINKPLNTNSQKRMSIFDRLFNRKK